MILPDIKALTEQVQKLDLKNLEKVTANVIKATAGRKWIPTPGPQMDAYHSPADVLLYGGQAGGGKSSLLVGLALTSHKRALLMRRQYSDLSGLIDDTLKQNGTRDGFNGSAPARLTTPDGRTIDYGGAKLPGDEEHWRGIPHDFLGLDEVCQFLESQVRFLMGWVRSDDPAQRCRIVLATNPPDKPILGRWLIEMFAPWLDPKHPSRAKPGELRWFITDEEGKDKEVGGPEEIETAGKKIKPMSRTFIPAALKDNPFLSDTSYAAQLDALPEPLRSAVRDGNWMISHEDDAWQIIPTNWLLEAQKRWTRFPPKNAPMTSMGVDVAQGGSDQTVIACRYDTWFDELLAVPGRETPLGTDVAALVLKHRRNNAQVILDMGGGYGGSAYEHLTANGIDVKAFKGAEAVRTRTTDRQLSFINRRAESYWRMREALDPSQQGGSPIALPPDDELLSDLAAPRYEITPRGIKAEAKEDIAKRIGRSTDKGDAVVMAMTGGATYETHGTIWKTALRTITGGRFVNVNRSHSNRRRR